MEYGKVIPVSEEILEAITERKCKEAEKELRELMKEFDRKGFDVGETKLVEFYHRLQVTMILHETNERKMLNLGKYLTDNGYQYELTKTITHVYRSNDVMMKYELRTLPQKDYDLLIDDVKSLKKFIHEYDPDRPRGKYYYTTEKDNIEDEDKKEDWE